MIRVGVDARFSNMPGIGRYTRCLLRGLSSHRREVEVLAYVTRDSDPGLPGLGTRTVPVSPFSMREQAYWPVRIARDRLDLFHAPYFVAPLLSPRPVVVTLHDLVYDRFPPRGLRAAPRRLYFRFMNRAAAARSRSIITVSDFTRGEVASRLGVNPDRMRVVPNALEPHMQPPPPGACEAVRAKYGLPGDFVLYIGTNKPWKNVPTLLEAFGVLARERPDCSLVLCGKQARNQDDRTEQVRRSGLGDRVREIGEIEDLDLPAVYAAARILVLPSSHEGFGLPVLEAMACGTPVITSSAGALPEVAGGAALIVEPLDVGGWAEAMERVWDEPGLRTGLREAGLARAKSFSVETMARDVIRVYEKALGR
jgi:alpha-1,3-rhamnosyl/mannosyltransferase